jgi:glycosyltransferase involved in cell wall biosynthesis
MRVAYLTNAPEHSGVGHQATEIKRALRTTTSDEAELTELHLDGVRGELRQEGELVTSVHPWPRPLGAKTITWLRLGRRVKRHLHAAFYDIVHATNQTLSFIRPELPLVVTVHDLIELLDPQQGWSRVAARYLYRGITSAQHLIAVSHYTATTVTTHLGIPPERITVIHNGVSTAFRPIRDFEHSIGYLKIRQELKLEPTHRVVLYVGSDHPRKNVLTALRAFAKYAERDLQAIFLKVGEPGIAAGREQLLQEIDRLQLRSRVRIVGSVSIERLNEIYNLADVLIFPSQLEGFGLPPLQAMAAGTPVITSNATSLPEVVGEAALLHDPADVEGVAVDIDRVLTDHKLAAELIKKGRERAQQFSWDKAARQTLGVYKKVLAK